MIDVGKCEFEESIVGDDMDYTVYYFTYPKEAVGDFSVMFTPFDSYDGEVVSLCIAMTDYGSGCFCLEVSPTVAAGDYLVDCDWRDTDDYDNDTIDMLLMKANEWRNR